MVLCPVSRLPIAESQPSKPSAGKPSAGKPGTGKPSAAKLNSEPTASLRQPDDRRLARPLWRRSDHDVLDPEAHEVEVLVPA